MSKGVFPKFVNALASEWAHKWPAITRAHKTYGATMPKASTFYLGSRNALARHVFLRIQNSPKSWQVGAFTINIIVSETEGMPSRWMRPHLKDFEQGVVGSYRIGTILHDEDKWWCLEPIDWTFQLNWTPSSYDDPDQVLREAVADVTNDVKRLLKKIDWRAA